MNLVEQIGSGIIRMKDLMQGEGLPVPEYKTEGMFTVILKRTNKTSEKASEKIFKLIKSNPEITIDDLAGQIGKTTRSIEMQIQKLKIQRIIERVGPDKGGHWKIINS
jgi:ATP-dependent DNA helicase RecG